MRTLRAMRLVAVSVVKNEADIIEAFVRHTLAWTDHHLIFDHDSTDGTREILQALQAEGLPVSLFRDDQPGHLQQARSNHLMRLAAQARDADWILPLDADEFIDGPGRPELEAALQQVGSTQSVSLPLLDYCASDQDAPTELNPVLRLRYCRHAPSVTRKIFVPRALALDPALSAGKGSHALYRGTEALPAQPLPDGWHLAHLALRSARQQVLRVVRAELQRMSRGRAAAGLDVHYRLGYQLLAEEPELFLSTSITPASALRERPLTYRGGALKHTAPQDWSRVARSLLPYLEQLATSHGRLADETGFDISPPAPADLIIREIPIASASSRSAGSPVPAFSGFKALSGWGPAEGPVPEAFLPQFHWGYAPATVLAIETPVAGTGQLSADLLTYSDHQAICIELNGVSLSQFAVPRTNQRERVSAALPLRVGRNELRLSYSQHLASPHDPRALAAIFLSLRVTPPNLA